MINFKPRPSRPNKATLSWQSALSQLHFISVSRRTGAFTLPSLQMEPFSEESIKSII